jgi:multiple sugar transport system ATP-binding protein
MNLVLENLSKQFRGTGRAVAAVNGIDLTAAEGEFLVLLGPSGCGKSTVLNLVAGLEKPDCGSVRYGDRVFASAEQRIFLPPGDRNVAMVFQSYALYPHMTVFENVAFPLRVSGGKPSDIVPAVREAARMLDIETILTRRPAELSGGQRQRVAIARALVRRPSVFLLDEPLSNLDVQLRTSTRSELKRLQEELGVTTLYVTHDQTEAMTLGHRVALLREGRLVQVGHPEALYLRPANVFAATFLGSPPMNILKGRIESSRLQLAGASVPLSHRTLNGAERAVLVGIRPEDLFLQSGNAVALDEPAIAGRIAAVESLGREVHYHVTVNGGAVLTVVQPDQRFISGELVTARFDPRSIHLFDSEGRRMTGAAAPRDPTEQAHSTLR